MKRYTRFGKCAVEDCRKVTKQTKEFLETVDMFDPNPDPRVLKGDLLRGLRAWRETKLYCEAHELEVNGNNTNTTDWRGILHKETSNVCIHTTTSRGTGRDD